MNRKLKGPKKIKYIFIPPKTKEEKKRVQEKIDWAFDFFLEKQLKS